MIWRANFLISNFYLRFLDLTKKIAAQKIKISSRWRLFFRCCWFSVISQCRVSVIWYCWFSAIWRCWLLKRKSLNLFFFLCLIFWTSWKDLGVPGAFFKKIERILGSLVFYFLNKFKESCASGIFLFEESRGP